MQSELNIGTLGHVDHGKTSLTQALSGKWSDTHSEELKRGITIKLGYADFKVYKCQSCPAPQCYSNQDKCPHCKSETKFQRQISLVDSPGHETLMATAIAASSIIDGALFLIAANEECPRPQTTEHLAVLEAIETDNIVVVQNKIDLPGKESVKKNHDQIKNFLKDSRVSKAPIIPVSANAHVNIDALLQAIEERIPTPKREEGKDPVMLVARSFDVNRPGRNVSDLIGGVVGGSLTQGKLTVGDEVEILPGTLVQKKGVDKYEPLTTEILALNAGSEELKEAKPGGLIGIATKLDPSIVKADALVGSIVGKAGKMPPVWDELQLEATPLERVSNLFQAQIGLQEPLVLGIGTATTVGFVTAKKKSRVEVKLKKPVCAQTGAKCAVLRRIDNRWRLYGTAKIV
jgi:translation initiation factor 2 subunit 3